MRVVVFFLLVFVLVVIFLVIFLVAVIIVIIMVVMIIVVVVGHCGGERGQLDAGFLDLFGQPEDALGVLLDHALP